jgi:hypothetical protein
MPRWCWGCGLPLGSIGMFKLAEDLRGTDMIGLAYVLRRLSHADTTTPEEGG